MDDFWDLISTFLAILVGALFVFGVLNLGEAADHNDCHSKGDLLQVQVTYRQWDGCYVKQGNLWVPFDTWKYNRDNGITK